MTRHFEHVYGLGYGEVWNTGCGDGASDGHGYGPGDCGLYTGNGIGTHYATKDCPSFALSDDPMLAEALELMIGL